MSTAIKVENVSKKYRLGEIGTGALSHDLHRAWAKLRGRPDPFIKVGEVSDRDRAGGECAWALKDVSFEVEQGEILGIIGRNGAGKSTLLKLLSRVTAPTTGKIKTRGRIASLLEVGTGFHPELTGRENVYLNGAIMGMTRPEITKRLEEIVEFSGCAKYIDTPVKRYSSGMTVRLGFSVAAHLECEILIVDEVLAVGDAEFQKKCIGKMQEFGSAGRTVLLVSHNMASIQRLCGRCLLLDRGSASTVANATDAVKLHLGACSPFSQETGRIISSIELRSRGELVSSIAPDETVELLVYLNLKNTPIESPRIGLGINDESGARLTTIATYFSDFEITAPMRGQVIATCKLEQLPLAPGNYRIKAAVGDQTQDLEVVENAMEIRVRPSDFFNSGRLPNRSQGALLIKSHWNLESRKSS